MSKSRPNGTGKKKPVSQPIQKPQKTQAEKCRDRYIFACVAMILYVMPAVSCLGMVYATGGSIENMVIGIVVSVLAVPVGLIGMSLYKKQKGRSVMAILCVLLCFGHVACAVLLGGWYAVMAPHFLLLLLCISGLKSIEGK